MKYLIKILLLILVFSSISTAQKAYKVTIKGKVIDEETKQSLEFVNVFLNNTTIGTITDSNGEFSINNIPFGNYNISFSYIGYKVETRNFESYKPYTLEFQISLKPKPINLEQVNVNAAIPKDWKSNLEVLKRIFIGETENSEHTEILNPEVLNIIKEESTGKLKVYSDSVLKVENKALGYMIYIVIDSVVYIPDVRIIYKIYPRFEELTPVSDEQYQEWKTNRQNTYLNSPKHFYYSLIHKQLPENYYTLRDSYGNVIPQEDLQLTCDEDSTIYKFKYSGKLEVIYNFNKKTILTFFYPSVSIDKYGNLLSYFYLVEKDGYWGNQRIADILPQDYIYKKD